MKIYVAMRNSNMTDGYGTMIPDSYFLKKEKAEEYIDNKCGIMGRRAKWSKVKYGDWSVEEINVIV